MCTKLNKVQQDLNSIYQSSIQLRENIIRACRDHSAINADLIILFTLTLDLINSLYTSIVNYETIHNFVSSQQSYLLNEKAEKNENYYIDRQYRKDDFNFRSNEENDKLFRKRQQQRRKRCFVCDKKEC